MCYSKPALSKKDTWYNGTPYNTHSLSWLWKVYIIYDYRATANNQWTINPIKMGKCLLRNPDPSPSSPSRTYVFTSVTSLPSGDTGRSVSPGRRWWTRVRIPEKAFSHLHRVDCSLVVGCGPIIINLSKKECDYEIIVIVVQTPSHLPCLCDVMLCT